MIDQPIPRDSVQGTCVFCSGVSFYDFYTKITKCTNKECPTRRHEPKSLLEKVFNILKK